MVVRERTSAVICEGRAASRHYDQVFQSGHLTLPAVNAARYHPLGPCRPACPVSLLGHLLVPSIDPVPERNSAAALVELGIVPVLPVGDVGHELGPLDPLHL